MHYLVSSRPSGTRGFSTSARHIPAFLCCIILNHIHAMFPFTSKVAMHTVYYILNFNFSPRMLLLHGPVKVFSSRESLFWGPYVKSPCICFHGDIFIYKKYQVGNLLWLLDYICLSWKTLREETIHNFMCCSPTTKWHMVDAQQVF